MSFHSWTAQVRHINYPWRKWVWHPWFRIEGEPFLSSTLQFAFFFNHRRCELYLKQQEGAGDQSGVNWKKKKMKGLGGEGLKQSIFQWSISRFHSRRAGALCVSVLVGKQEINVQMHKKKVSCQKKKKNADASTVNIHACGVLTNRNNFVASSIFFLNCIFCTSLLANWLEWGELKKEKRKKTSQCSFSHLLNRTKKQIQNATILKIFFYFPIVCCFFFIVDMIKNVTTKKTKTWHFFWMAE